MRASRSSTSVRITTSVPLPLRERLRRYAVRHRVSESWATAQLLEAALEAAELDAASGPPRWVEVTP